MLYRWSFHYLYYVFVFTSGTFFFYSFFVSRYGLFFSFWRSPLNISCKVGLVVMNFFSFSFLLVWVSILNGNLARYVVLCVKFFPFSILDVSCQFILGLPTWWGRVEAILEGWVRRKRLDAVFSWGKCQDKVQGISHIDGEWQKWCRLVSSQLGGEFKKKVPASASISRERSTRSRPLWHTP